MRDLAVRRLDTCPEELSYERVYAFVDGLFGSALVAKQAEVLAHVATGAIHAEAQHVATLGRIGALGFAAARKRGLSESRSQLFVDRLLSDRRLDLATLQQKLVAHFTNDISELQISLEWLCFEPDGHRTLVVMLRSEGRIIPVMWQTISDKHAIATRHEVEEAMLIAFETAVRSPAPRISVLDEATETFRELKTQRLGFGMYFCTMSTALRRDRLFLALICAALLAELGAASPDTVPQSRVRTRVAALTRLPDIVQQLQHEGCENAQYRNAHQAVATP